MGCSQAKLVSRVSEQALDVPPYKLLYTTSLEQWMNGDAERWDFHQEVDLSCKKYRLQPWSTDGHHFEVLLPAPLDQQDLDVKYVNNQVLINENRFWKSHRIKLSRSYKHLLFNKLKTAPFLENAQVVGYRDNMAVIQITRVDRACDFVIVDLASSTIRGQFSQAYQDQPYLYECLISPDKTKFLLKPNILYALKFRIQGVEDNLKVIGKNDALGSYQVSMELFKDCALDLIITFDPRYRNSRIAVGNLTKRGQHVLCLYSLRSRKIVQKTYGPQYQRTQNLVFSPGGEYLAALIVTYILGPNMSPQRFNFLGVMIYNADSLTMLHKIQSFGTNCVPSLTPAAVFPVFSRTGQLVAMGGGAGTGICRVELYRMPPPVSLQGLCRARINEHLATEQIEALVTSKNCKDYLLYKPIFD